MKSDVIPPIGAQVGIHRTRGHIESVVPAEVVAHLRDAALGDVLELRVHHSGTTLQRIWPSPTIELPPAA